MKNFQDNAGANGTMFSQENGITNEVMTDENVKETLNGALNDSQSEKNSKKRKAEKPETVLSKEYYQEILNCASSESRFPILMSCCFFQMKDNRGLFAELLGDYYLLCDNLFHYKEQSRIAFQIAANHKDRLMTAEALDFYESLPEKVSIYRGMTVKESRQRKWNYGLSWTLDKKVAEFFAYEYKRNFATQHEPKTVLEAIIDKKDIVAIFLEREESEVICLNVKRENIVKQW